MCHMSCVTGHVSQVTFHMSHVTFRESRVIIIFLFYFLSAGATRRRVCYQRGLPRLVIRPGVAGADLQTALSLIN